MDVTDTPDWQQELAPLLRRIAQRRDPLALERLYRLTSARLMGLILRILQDEAASADQLQELYLKIWYRAGQYDGRGSAWGWLCIMARNAALDLRRSQRNERDLTDNLDAVTAQLAIEPDNPLWQDHAMQRCLQQLDPKACQLILLSYIHGYSHRELQNLTPHPLGTIKSLIRRGLMELKRCLHH